MATNPYWTPPVEFTTRKKLLPITNNMGFQFTLPWQLPSTAGYYYGENPVWGRREYVYSAQPEWYSVDNIVPSAGNVPLINPYTSAMKFSRADYTVKR